MSPAAFDRVAAHMWEGEQVAASWEAGERLIAGTPCRWSVAVTRGDGAELWGYVVDEPLKAASTIKLAVLIALFRALDAGQIGLDDERVLRESDKVAGSGVLSALHAGLAPTLHDLAHLMIAISDNTASNLCIEAAGGLAAVNAVCHDLGATRTVLGRKFLGRAAQAGEAENLTTARDLTILLRAILDGSAASRSSCERMLALLRAQTHRDRLARFLPASIGFAGKTGTLAGTALDAGLLFAPGGPLIVAAIANDLPADYAADETMGRLALAAVETWGR
jgi:beta-lactamase class A